MERKAQQAISKCVSEAVPGNFGQNNIAMSGGSLPDEIFASIAMSNWVNTVKFFGMNSPSNKYDGMLCQFANMAHSKATKLGCAYKKCGGNFLVTCLYDKVGTLPNTIMWEKGEACKKDDDCNTYSGSTCSNGLCKVGGSSTSGSDKDNGNDSDSDKGNDGNKPVVAPSKASCKTNNGMSDAARQKFLDMHNQFRSLVAKGQAKDKLGGNAPKAARMKKMIYDCNIETTAMKHAKRCKFEHSPKEERPELGENVYTITAINMDKTNVAGMASKKWFGELEKFGVGQKNYFDLSLINRPKTQIDHYTQMVWQDSYKLGCYVEWCPTQTLAVCQYNPKGNMLKSYIYETGNPCKKDADCNCNCKCSVEEGLCIVQ
ncbi:hypothetical protein Aduo_014179 [Ancylostoma duodenale]